jgi:SpoVK/Ycf46/Vps4 family AAA+-type ATPase
LVQMFIGDGAKLVCDAFKLAKEKMPAIIPTGELDTIGTKRFDSDKSGDCKVQRTTLELLNQLDGFGDERIKVIAATNRIDILYPALLRSGRLDRKIEFPLPNETAQAHILEIHSHKMTAAAGVNFKELSGSTDKFNGAQLKAICVVQMFTGNSTKLVSNASEWDKEKVPAIIFIDGLDAIGTKRFDSDKDSDQEAQCTDTSNKIWDPYQATNASRSHNCGNPVRRDITCLPSLQDGWIMPALQKEEWQQLVTAENEFVLELATNLRCNASAPRDTLPTTRLWNLAHVTLTSRPNLGKWPGYGQTMDGIHPNRANQVGITLNDTASHLRPDATNNCEASPARSPQSIGKREHQLLIIDPEDIHGCQEAMPKLCLHVRHYACRYARLICGVVDELAPQPTKDIPNDGNILKVTLHQRREKIQEKEAWDLAGFLPKRWHRYNPYFKPLSSHKALAGFVTRVAEAKPLLLANAYTCNTRRSEISQATSDERFLWCSIDPEDIHDAVIDPDSLDCGCPASLNSLLAPGPRVGRTMTAYQDRVLHLSQEPTMMLASPLVASLPDYQCPTGTIMHPFEQRYLTWAQRSSHDPLHTTTQASNPQGITKWKDCKTRHATYNWERRISLHPVLNLVWSIPALSYNSATKAPGIEFASGPDTLSPRLALGYGSAASTRLSSTTTSRLHSMTKGDTQGDPVGFVASMTRQSRQTSFVAAVRSGHSTPNENGSPTDSSDETKQRSWRLFSVMDTCQIKHRRSIPCVPQEGAIVHGTCAFRAIHYPKASEIFYYSEPQSLRPTPSANLGATMLMHCDEELPSCQWLSMMPHVGHVASLSGHQYYTAVDRSSCEQLHNVVTLQGQAAGSPDDQQGKPKDNMQDSCLSPSLLLPPYPANITTTPLTKLSKAQEASMALHDDADNNTAKEDLPTIVDCVCPTGKMALVTGPH